jgi:hypothetical protein
VLPLQPGHAEQRTQDYVRHGTTTLFAALDIATGQVTRLCKQRHRHQEFLRLPQAGLGPGIQVGGGERQLQARPG